MAFWKRTPKDNEARAADARENLFLMFDKNVAKHLGRQHFWQALHALDAELTPGAVMVEPFVPDSSRGIEPADLPEQMFSKGCRRS